MPRGMFHSQSGLNPIKRWVLVAVLLVYVSGCVIIPLSPDRSAPALAGHKLGEKELEFIIAGVTTRDEVITRLGNPSVELDGFGIFAYPWMELKRNWVVAGVSPAGLGGVSIPETRDLTLFVAIGRDGVVLKWGLDQKQRSDRFSIVTQARRWAQSNALILPPRQSGFSVPTIAPGQAVIVLYRVKPAISALGYLKKAPHPEPVSVAVDSQYRAELLDGDYVVIQVSAGSHTILVDPVPPYRYWPGHPGLKSFSGIHSSTFTLEVMANELYFLETQATLEIGLEIVTQLSIRNESEAKRALVNEMSIW
jgi:hypothetical protein